MQGEKRYTTYSTGQTVTNPDDNKEKKIQTPRLLNQQRKLVIQPVQYKCVPGPAGCHPSLKKPSPMELNEE